MALSIRALHAGTSGGVGEALSYLEGCERPERAGVEDAAAYLSEGGRARPRMKVWGRDETARAELETTLGVRDGQALSREQAARMFGAAGQERPLAPGADLALGRAWDSGRAGAHTRASLRGQQLVFSAPKSVSVLAEVTEDESVRERIWEAHRASVDSTMAWLASVSSVRVTRDGVTRSEAVDGLAAVAWEHETARPVNGIADPHIHTHVLVSGRARSRDGAWRAVDNRDWAIDAARRIFEAHFRAEISSGLGLSWQPVGESGTAELTGWTDEMARIFSRRTDGIARREAQLRAADPELRARQAHERARVDTREDKTIGAGEVRRRLNRERGREGGGRLSDLGRGGGLGIDDPGVSAQGLLDAVSAEQASFTRDDLVGRAASMLPAGTAPGEVVNAAQALASQAMSLAVSLEGPAAQVMTPAAARTEQGVRVGTRRRAARWTTREVVDEAHAILRGASEELGPTGAEERLETGGLSAEQASAARHLARGQRRVSVLEAGAGTGKTHTLRAVASALRAQGWEVTGLAPSGRAAAQLRDDGVAETAGTLHSAAAAIEAGTAPWTRRDGVARAVVVDEAAMASSQHLRALIDSTAGTPTRLVLVGDSRQLPAVRARQGGFAELSRDLGAADLRQVHRQTDPAERAATMAARDGDPAAAAAWFVRENRTTMGNSIAIVEEAARRLAVDEADGVSSVVVAGDARTVADVNYLRQQARIADLSPEEVGPTVPLRGIDPSRPERAGAGDVIVTRQNARSILASDGSHILNGMRWRVNAVGQAGVEVSALDRPEVTATLPANWARDHTHLGWAVTTHTSQGGTWDRAHAIIDAGADRAQAYVALTRGRRTDVLIREDGAVGRDDTAAALITDPAEHTRVLADVLARTSPQASVWEAARQAMRDPAEIARASHLTAQQRAEAARTAPARLTAHADRTRAQSKTKTRAGAGAGERRESRRQPAPAPPPRRAPQSQAPDQTPRTRRIPVTQQPAQPEPPSRRQPAPAPPPPPPMFPPPPRGGTMTPPPPPAAPPVPGKGAGGLAARATPPPPPPRPPMPGPAAAGAGAGAGAGAAIAAALPAGLSPGTIAKLGFSAGQWAAAQAAHRHRLAAAERQRRADATRQRNTQQRERETAERSAWEQRAHSAPTDDLGLGL